ncbi:MAG: hypothetical protein KC422_10905 [Trueperaceae bacterium]|nr:hypothetical protein [Trueperaceae bacterium]
MAKKIDKHGYLESEPFDYRISKDGKVFLLWEGRQVKTLAGKEADRFIAKVGSLDTQALQLALAKLTGNFKRGNER